MGYGTILGNPFKVWNHEKVGNPWQKREREVGMNELTERVKCVKENENCMNERLKLSSSRGASAIS